MTRRWLLLFGLCVLAYLPAPGSELVWDDAVFVDYQLERFRTLRDFFQPPDNIVRFSYGYYRPVLYLTNLLDARLFGAGMAAGPHVVNVLMHFATTLLVWQLLRRVPGSRPAATSGAALPALAPAERPALFGAALFAVHPIHTESVSWIAGRSDVLATLLLLAALVLALHWRDARSAVALVAAPACFLLALLAKESAIAGLALLPLLLVLAPAARREGTGRIGMERRALIATAAIAGAFLAAVAVYFWLRAWAGTPAGVVRDLGMTERGLRLARATAWYAVKLVFPWPQNALVSWHVAPAPLPAIAIVAGLLAVTGTGLRGWWRGRGSALLLASGWFWITLSVPLWIAISGANNTPLAERYLYLPSVALSILAAAALARSASSPQWRAWGGLAATAIIAVGTVASLQRGLAWRSDLTLWQDATRGPAVRGLAWLNLGLNQMEAGDDAAAVRSLARVREDPEIEPSWIARAENTLGTIALRSADLAAAERHFRAATAAMPENHEPHYGLAAVYQERAARAADAGDIAARDAAAEQAIGFYVAALSRNALYHPVRLRFADFLRQAGDWQRDSGAVDAARRRYGAALAQLDELDARIPTARRDYVYGKIIPEAGADPAALRNLLATRLRVAGAGPVR